MRKLLGILGAATLALALTTVALAHSWEEHGDTWIGNAFTAKLTGAQAVPSVNTAAKGVAQFHVRGNDRIDRSTNSDMISGQDDLVWGHDGAVWIRYRIIVRNIDKVTGAHIHCAERGVNGPVIAEILPSGTLTRTPGGIWIARGVATVEPGATCETRNGSEVAVTSARELLRVMRRGLTYTDVHTLDFPNGEVRGQNRPSWRSGS